MLQAQKSLKKLYVIQTRYTLINNNVNNKNWRAGRGRDPDELFKLLLDDDRLKTRSDIFFGYTLPAIAKAVDDGYNIIHNIFHFDAFPSWLLNLIGDAQKKYPWFHAHSFALNDECSLQDTLRSTIRNSKHLHNSEERLYFAGIRLDDDDVIGGEYFLKLSAYLAPAFVGFAVSFPKGYAALWDGVAFSKFAELYKEKHAQGIAQINSYDPASGSFAHSRVMIPGAHLMVDQQVPTILDSRGSPTYLRSFHKSNDKYVARRELQEKQLKKVFEKELNASDLAPNIICTLS